MSRIESAEDFVAVVPTGALLGLDPGTKTIGIAVSDERRTLATPLETIQRTKFKADAARLSEIVKERGITGIVVGMPVNMTGDAGPRAQAVRAFIRSVEDALGLPVLPWDERLSTVAVERTMIEADMSRAKRAAQVDRAAAAFILQGALDRFAILTRDT